MNAYAHISLAIMRCGHFCAKVDYYAQMCPRAIFHGRPCGSCCNFWLGILQCWFNTGYH